MPHLRATGVTEDQYRIITDIKKAGVFKRTRRSDQQDLPPEEMPVAIEIGCSDGKRFMRQIKFHYKEMRQILHRVPLIGGGCAFHGKSPFNTEFGFPQRWLIGQILQAASPAVMNTKLVSEYIHFPCGGARVYGVTIPQQIELGLLGYGVLQEELGSKGFEITHYAHAHYGEDNGFDARADETFEIDREAWYDIRARYADELGRLPVRLTEFATA